MKTAIVESDAEGLLALAPTPRTEISFRATGIDACAADWPNPPAETAAGRHRDFPPIRSFGDIDETYEILNVLLVQAYDDDVVQRLAELEQSGYIPLHHRVETREDFLAALKSRAWDAVIADHVLPEFSGPEALKLLRNQGSDIPFIMVSDVFGEEKADIMIKAGANDYILKENYSRLIPVLERELKAAQVRRRHQRAERVRPQLVADLRDRPKVVARAMLAFGDHEILETNHSGPATSANTPSENETATDLAGSSGEFPTLRALEKQHVFAALDRCQDNRQAAAALLGISVRTLRNKLHKYNDTSPKPGPQLQNQADRFTTPASTRPATSQLLADSNPGHPRFFPEAVNCETTVSPRRLL